VLVEGGGAARDLGGGLAEGWRQGVRRQAAGAGGATTLPQAARATAADKVTATAGTAAAAWLAAAVRVARIGSGMAG